eukprot:GSChrysophyteH1.ASY1.ANO1.3004.1 assembled CDS
MSVLCEDLEAEKESSLLVKSTTSPVRLVSTRSTKILESRSRKIAFTTQACRINVLLHPNLIFMLEFKQLAHLSELNKSLRKVVKSNSNQIAYWRAMCISFSGFKKIYSPLIYDLAYMGKKPRISNENAKKHFFNDLWSIRNKWNPIAEENSSEFKIRVAARFRPGLIEQKSMNLPLHQFLKLRREGDGSTGVLFGQVDPSEFLDPFLNVLMREPVLLTTADKVCERAIAIQCMHRNQKCPFTGKRLSMQNIIPQIGLQKRIQEWKMNKGEVTKQQLQVDQEAVKKNLIESSAIDPELLEILQDAEKLTAQANKATKLARRRKISTSCDSDSDSDAEADADTTINDDDDNNVNDTNGNNAVADDTNIGSMNEDISARSSHLDVADDSFHSVRKNAQEKPRLIDVSEKKCEVNMHVGGVGVRTFNYSNVFDGSTTQTHLYDSMLRSSISHLMNGFNSCILCYGQTGSGKTHTFFGPENTLDFDTSLLQNVSHRHLPDSVARGVNVSICIQYIEIYEDNVTDLMTGDVVHVQRATGDVSASLTPIIDVESMVRTLTLGQERKRFAATAMNERSSRSHTAMVIQVMQVDTESEGKSMIKSQMHLVDLAGSERVKKSKVQGNRLSEAIGINKSLIAAFGGNSRTTAIICGRPDEEHGEETLQSLRFGERCSMISNKTKALASSAEATLAALNESLSRVQSQLRGLETRGKSHLPSFAKLKASCESILHKRDELANTVQKHASSESTCKTNAMKIKVLKSIAQHETGVAIAKDCRYNADMIKTI